MAWFAVRTFFRTRFVGRPRNKDSHFRSGLAAIEDRIVLFRARNSEAAFKHAEKEARKYIQEHDDAKIVNVYGQRLVLDALRHVEAYELFTKPGHGEECYSSMELVSAGENVARFVARKIGKSTKPRARLFFSDSITRRLDQELPSWSSPPAKTHSRGKSVAKRRTRRID